MKKWLSMALILTLVIACVAATAEVGMANPWTDTDAAGLMDALGLELGVPEGATNVEWRMLEAEQMGELCFRWNDEDYTARIAPADEFEDISGMYFEWEQEEGCQVGRCQGVCFRAHDGGNTVDLCLWYDALTGLMYSLSVTDTDLDGFDITAAAQQVFVPMQTE